MAFSKPITVRGVEGSYMRPVAWRADDNTRELSVTFALFVDKAHSDRCKPDVPPALRDRPLLDTVAKLRVSGDQYEAVFGATALAAAAELGIDMRAAVYSTAKAVAQTRRTQGRDEEGAYLVSDFGGDLFADARNV